MIDIKKLFTMLYIATFTLISTPSAYANEAKQTPYIFGSIEKSDWNRLCSIVVLEAYKKMGWPAQVTFLPGKRSLILSTAGEIDGEIGRIKRVGEYAPSLSRVPTPYISLKGVAVYINDKIKIDSADDLSDYKVGVLYGASFTHELIKNVESIYANSVDQLFQLLLFKRVDLIIITDFTAELIIAKDYPNKGIKISPTPLIEFPIYHYVHADHAHHIPRIDLALQQIIQEDRITEIRQQYIQEYPKKID